MQGSIQGRWVDKIGKMCEMTWMMIVQNKNEEFCRLQHPAVDGDDDDGN